MDRITKAEREKLAKERLGETRMMNCGMEATITAYRKVRDIDVKFANGAERTGVSYEDFERGGIRPTKINRRPPTKIEDRIGETRVLNNGMTATVISAKDSKHLFIRFEDGVEKGPVSWRHFDEGAVSHPTKTPHRHSPIQEFAFKYYLDKLGFIKINQGEWKDRGFGNKELDFYHPVAKIAIESDGSAHVFKGVRERELEKDEACANLGITLYRFRDPSLPKLNSTSICIPLKRSQRIISGMFDCTDELVEILKRHNILYEDGFINFNRDMHDIMMLYSKIICHYQETDGTICSYCGDKLYIGQKVFHKATNQYMTIKEIYGYHDVTVVFDDGAVRKNVKGSHFKRGEVRHPTIKKQAMQMKNRVGLEVFSISSNMMMEIIEYQNCRNITVRFENGVVVSNVRYERFITGRVRAIPKNKESLAA